MGTQTSVKNGAFSCYGIAIILAMRVHALDLRSIENSSTKPGLLKELFMSCFNYGAALTNVLRIIVSKRSVDDLDSQQIITPRNPGLVTLYPNLSTLFIHDVEWYCKGIIESVDYDTQKCQHRSISIADAPHHGGQPVLDINELFKMCTSSNAAHVLHLELFQTQQTEGNLEPEPQHSTLLISEKGRVWHIDTFPTDIRLVPGARALKSTRIRSEEADRICSWFMLTYIPAGTPYMITASRVASKSRDYICFEWSLR